MFDVFLPVPNVRAYGWWKFKTDLLYIVTSLNVLYFWMRFLPWVLFKTIFAFGFALWKNQTLLQQHGILKRSAAPPDFLFALQLLRKQGFPLRTGSIRNYAFCFYISTKLKNNCFCAQDSYYEDQSATYVDFVDFVSHFVGQTTKYVQNRTSFMYHYEKRHHFNL